MTFSIITCTYNSVKYLQKNIDSVASQTCDDFEHIFIDGFSSDGTMAIISTYQEKYPNRVKVYQYKPQGISHAMNKGISVSHGDYIMHLHSDDALYHEKVLEIVCDHVTKYDQPDMIYGKAHVTNVENNETMIRPFLKIGNKKLRFWLLLLINYIPHQAVFLKRNVFERYGKFDESLVNAMDHDLWVRLAKKKINAQYIDEIICNFLISNESQTINNKFNDDCLAIHKKYFRNRIMLGILFVIDRLNKAIVYNLFKVTRTH